MFGAVTGEEMRAARIVTGAAMALFVAISIAPGLRRHAARLRLALLVVYLAVCAVFIFVVSMR